MTSNDFSFYGHADYYRDLVVRIEQTKHGDSVALATMNFEPRVQGVQSVVDALSAAASRSVNVKLVVDAYNFLVSKNKLLGPMWFSKDLPRHMPAFYQRKLAALQQLENSGGHYVITNVPARQFRVPFGGRSHIKYARINDYVYVGGCNLGITHIDLMVGWHDPTLAEWLGNFADAVMQTKDVSVALNNQDVVRGLDDQTELLVDAGVAGQSIIYEKALELIDQAQESIYITCQFFPNSQTTKRLVQAHKRGVKVTVIFNHPWQHGAHYPLQQAVVWRERARTPKVFFANQLARSHTYLHAKLIATEKGAIVGSHNYVPIGVELGTAEIALLRHEPEFALAAIRAIKDQLLSE